MTVKNLNHVAIAVKNLDESLKLFENLFGLKASKIETVQDQGVKAALIPIGTGEIELIEPINPNGGVAKFIEQKGEGIHHICIEVDDTDKELQAAAYKNVLLLPIFPHGQVAGLQRGEQGGMVGKYRQLPLNAGRDYYINILGEDLLLRSYDPEFDLSQNPHPLPLSL